MPEVQKGIYVSDRLLEERRNAYFREQKERREAKKQAKAKLEEAYKNGEKKRKRFWLF